jgi:phenylacetate-CoA ligase
MTMADPSPHFDALETRSVEERERAQFARLRQLLRDAQQACAGYSSSLAGIDPESIRNRNDLAGLPLLRKSDLKALQEARPPFAGLLAKPVQGMAKLFQSPGPLYEPEGRSPDYWRCTRALHAAGIRRGDILHNAFSYHLTPAGSMIESGALHLGCTVIPAGTGQTELQLRAIADLKPNAYAGTPSFLRILLEKAAELGSDVSSLKHGLVSGEALPPSLRAWFAERGIAVTQMFGTADLGTVAYETRTADGTLVPGMIVDEQVIVELVQPGSGTPVAAGEIGELVVTALNDDYPLIRFATGDLSAQICEPSPCGRTGMRIKGWLGRADQTTKVRGMFVYPSQLFEIMRRHAELGYARLVVSGAMAQDQLRLLAETAATPDDALRARIEASVREVTKLRAEVEWCAPGSLPRDGKAIDDQRSYD